MTMTRLLLWKEWRESRLLLFFSVMAMAAICCCSIPWYGSAVLLPVPLMLVGALLGAQAFSGDAERLGFLLSNPVSRQKVMALKLCSSLLGIVVVLVVAGCTAWGVGLYRSTLLLKEVHWTIADAYHPKGQLLYYGVPQALLSYTLAFFMSSLLLNVPTSLLIGLFGGVYITIPVHAVLVKWHRVGIYPALLAALCLVLIFASFLIFARREIRS